VEFAIGRTTTDFGETREGTATGDGDGDGGGGGDDDDDAIAMT
jgi:hypothetical protein